eukprot:3601269-Amphidinium_carterae.1
MQPKAGMNLNAGQSGCQPQKQSDMTVLVLKEAPCSGSESGVQVTITEWLNRPGTERAAGW